jgi:LysR family transcriptional regulator, hydrogen peroxide-inducible genes activator
MRPSLRQLEYLVALAESRHFRRAAEASFVTQPALSSQIQELEKLLGTRLFERDRRKVLPTPAGTALAKRAKGILAQVDELVETARGHADPLAGPLRLGVIPTVAPYLLPRVLPRVRRELPLLRLYLREEQTAVLLQLLREGQLELLVLALPCDERDFESLPLFEDPFLLAVPKHHRLAAKKLVREQDLEGEEVLLLEDGHCLRDQALELCRKAGLREHGDFRASSLGTLLQMVASGIGVTFLPSIAATPEALDAGGIVARPFEKPAPRRTIGMVWRASSPRKEGYRRLAELMRA